MSEKPSFRKQIEKLSKEEPLGTGIQKAVYVDSADDTRVRKVFHPPYVSSLPDMERDALEMQGIIDPTIWRQKRSFYLAKIFHFLFPDNIPNRHQATSEPYTTLDERVEGIPVSMSLLNFFSDDAKAGRELIQKLRNAGLFVDTKSKDNFVKKADGSIAYLDDLNRTFVSHLFTKRFYEKVHAAIEEEPDGTEKERAFAWLERYKELNK